MKDIANQLALKWAREGSDVELSVIDDYTRLTLDTIALCTMDYRFNSFYSEKQHPFVSAMLGTLAAAGASGARPPFVNKALRLFRFQANNVSNAAVMNSIAQEIIDHRRKNPREVPDLLNTMIYGKDPKTGQSMRDELISAQMLTFLIAGTSFKVLEMIDLLTSRPGHETTSGLLSFATLFLLQNPEAYRKVQEEVDTVIGRAPVELGHLKNLKYVEAVLRETLRLSPSAPRITKYIRPEKENEIVTLGGRYKIEPRQRVSVLLSKSMQDPKIWGDDAREFKPERMLESSPGYRDRQQYWKVFISKVQTFP